MFFINVEVNIAAPCKFKSSIPLLIDGEFRNSTSSDWLNVINPSTGEIISKVPYSTEKEMSLAVESSLRAFESWSKIPVPERARLFFNYLQLLNENKEDIAKILCTENGKSFEDGKGDIWRGIEVVEYATSASSMLMGETVKSVASNIETYSYKTPIGVCLGITPFNFPAMVPLWMFPIAIACGNTFILKPSEQTPYTAIILSKLFLEAGFPKGVLNVIHGGADQVNYLIKNPGLKAVSFVGSSKVGKHVYSQASKNLKRVQVLAGAKNHLVVMPDANKEQAINALVSSSCGAAGQRCMAISVAVLVGESSKWIQDLKTKLQSLKPGSFEKKESTFGPLISKNAQERVENLINSGVEEGADLLLDGRGLKIKGFENGFFIGPTLFDSVTTEMKIYKEEIFGPVLIILRANNLEEAIKIISENQYGNGTSIYTTSGPAARKFKHEVKVGQVGVNIPIPVAPPFFSFTGWKNSFFGDSHAYGKDAFHFYSETKTITERWFDEHHEKSLNMTIQLG